MEAGDDLRGGTGAVGLWDTRRMCVFDVRPVNMYTDTYVCKQPHKVLKHHERHKKGKYLEA